MDFTFKDGAMNAQFGYGPLHISGDEDYGIRPFQLLVSSVAGCSGTTLKKILDKKRLDVEGLKIQADVDRNPDQANRVEKIYLHFIIQGKDLDDAQIKKSLETAKKNCSMVQSVIGAIEVEETYEIAS